MFQPLESSIVGMHIVATFIKDYIKILQKGIWIDTVYWVLGRNVRNYHALDKQKVGPAFSKYTQRAFKAFFFQGMLYKVNTK